MHKESTRKDYALRLNRVIEHIALNLDQDLSVDTLAEIACFSSYHFHRIYQGMQGETVIATIRRLRLSRAAAALVGGDQPVRSIAIAAGYASPEAFTRAFSNHFGITPARYREQGSLFYPQPTTMEELSAMYTVELKDFPTMRLAAMRHTGNYLGIGSTFEKLSAWAAAGNHFKPDTVMLGIYYDDPDTVPEADLRSDAALTIDETVTADDTVSIIERPAINGAVIIHKGPYAELLNGYHWLYREWLPSSGREPDDHPPHEIYLNDPRETPPADLLTEICIPLKAA